MVWPFTLQRTVILKKTIHASTSQVLAVLQNPNALLTISPLVTNVTPHSSEPSNTWYTIAETLSFAGLFSFQIKFKCQLDLVEDGVNTDVFAGLGTRVKGHYRVSPIGDEVSEVTDETVVEGIFFLLPYILSTTKTHKFNLEVLAEKAENRTMKHDRLSFMFSDFLSGRMTVVTMLMVVIIYCLPSAYPIPMSLIFISFLYWLNTTHDPYGLFHLSLNKLPGEDANSPPKTEWLNMGFWKDTNIFPEACQALWFKLIQAAQCQNGERILDVGHGTGESLITLLSQPTGHRPSAITGITSLPVHHERTQARVDRLLSFLPNSLPQVNLYLGDAVCRHSQNAHPLDSSSLTSFDRILALDCAYHFNTRLEFLRQGYSKLAPGGRIALADICFDANMLQSRQLWFLSWAFSLMPRHNMVSSEEYVAQMKDIGYVDVNLEDITEEVFPGFVRFLKSRGMGWRLLGSIIGWYHKAGTRFVIVSGCRQKQ